MKLVVQVNLDVVSSIVSVAGVVWSWSYSVMRGFAPGVESRYV